MKNLKKIISAFVIIMCVSVNLYCQSEQHMKGYNAALNFYNDQDYQSALNYLNSYMTPMEENPNAWISPGPDYVEFIYRVYRLAASCYYNSGDSGSSDVIVDNLIYVLSDSFYEGDIIKRYNSTAISPY